MQSNKAIMFFLVVAFLVMTLFATVSTIDLADKVRIQEQTLQELHSANENLDDLSQLLIEEIDLKNLAQQKLAEKEVEMNLPNRSKINDYDISRPSGRTAEEIDKMLVGTNLKGLGQSIFEAEGIYSVNGIFIVSVAKLESGGGTTYLSKTKNNLFGLNAWGSTRAEINKRAYSYATKGDCIKAFSKIIRENYINKGRNTIKLVSDIYCEKPSYWSDKITILMEQNIQLLNK